MRGAFAGGMGLFFVYMLLLSGASLGANIGYSVDTIEQTEISVDADAQQAHLHEDIAENETIEWGEDSIEADSSESEVEARLEEYGVDFDRNPIDISDTVVGEQINQTVEQMTYAMMDSAFVVTLSIADVTATWFYEQRSWLPQSVVQVTLAGAAIAPLAGVALMFRRMIR